MPVSYTHLIENGKAVRKEKPMPPKRLVNIVKCRNPRCISSIEEECDQIFELSSNGKYRCICLLYTSPRR